MKIACALFAYNRPHYLKPVLKSIIGNTHFDKVDWYIIQDSPEYIMPNKEKSVIKEHIKPVKESTEILKDFSNYKNVKALKINLINQGIPRNKSMVHDLVIKGGYDAVIFFEDDLIVSRYYIRLLTELFSQFPKYIISGSDLTKGEQFENPKLNEIARFNCHWWGYIMGIDVIEMLQPHLQEYINVIGPCYPKRPHEFIRKKFGIHVTSHDGFIEKVTKDYGIQRLNFCLPRSRYIGAVGVHSKQSMYEGAGFNNFKDFEFEEDATLTDFVWRD